MLPSFCSTAVALLHKHFCPLSHLPPWSCSTQPLSMGKLARKQLCFGQTLSLIPLFFHWLVPAVSWRRKERDGDAGGGRKCKGFAVTTPTKHLLSTVAVRAHALRTAPPLCMKKGLTRCLFLLKHTQQNLVCQEREGEGGKNMAAVYSLGCLTTWFKAQLKE